MQRVGAGWHASQPHVQQDAGFGVPQLDLADAAALGVPELGGRRRAVRLVEVRVTG
jgi:hypothetical protein